jgi:hypothetical protein
MSSLFIVVRHSFVRGILSFPGRSTKTGNIEISVKLTSGSTYRNCLKTTCPVMRLIVHLRSGRVLHAFGLQSRMGIAENLTFVFSPLA